MPGKNPAWNFRRRSCFAKPIVTVRDVPPPIRQKAGKDGPADIGIPEGTDARTRHKWITA